MKWRNWFWHGLAWTIFWGFPTLLRMREEGTGHWGTLFSVIGVSTVLSSVHFRWIEKYLDQQQYRAYWLHTLFSLLLSNTILAVLMSVLRQEVFRFFDPLFSLTITLLLSAGAYYVQSGIQRQVQLQEARARQLEAEMQLLKMQIQPHFLFNALNNLYATNLQDSAKANEMILQLADLLRYQLEISKRTRVALEEEITLTQHYVELEKIRRYDATVEWHTAGEFASLQITPLLFLPLVENAFKYSAGIGPQVIQISFVAQENTLVFQCKNSVAAQAHQKKSNQIGLQNVRQRLLADYPQQHNLQIEATPDYYHLTLTLQLKRA